MKLQIESANVLFKVNNVNKGVVFRADETHLQNAICNLIDNAIKYSDSTPEIIFNVAHNNDCLEFVVADNGIGMDRETQKRVFDKFYRVQSGNIHKVKGFGIGLSYVKAIVDAHGGEIMLKSQINKGTTVTISIPV